MNQDSDKFSGFFPESLDILRDLKGNKSKSWFETHRSEYEQHLLSQLRTLAAGLTPL